tara:strand:- start:2393 stop:3142 length:750 start_codon:yes stop_codon:yes gene_type:complete
MSKQLKLRFHKLLKKADFVLADLEYHEELLGEAKSGFGAAVADFIKSLPPEIQKSIAETQRINQEKTERELRQAAAARNAEGDDATEVDDTEGGASTALVESDVDYVEEDEVPEDSKGRDLKKLFHRIAAITHPDKARVNGTSKREAIRLEKLFKKARKAYDEQNWYILYSIAVELELDVEDPDIEQLDWLDNDIRRIMVAISQIDATIAWTWFAGDDLKKQMAIASFLEQVYGLSIPVSLAARDDTNL